MKKRIEVDRMKPISCLSISLSLLNGLQQTFLLRNRNVHHRGEQKEINDLFA